MPTNTIVCLSIAGICLLSALGIFIKCWCDLRHEAKQYNKEHDLP